MLFNGGVPPGGAFDPNLGPGYGGQADGLSQLYKDPAGPGALPPPYP